MDPYGSGPFPPVCVVIPCYNEEQRLPTETFTAFATAEPTIRFVMVDDGSSDGTRALLDRLVASAPSSFEVCALERNGGKAAAVRAGMLRALEAGDEPLIGFLDADLATPLEAIRLLARRLGDAPAAQMVLGSRVKLMGSAIERKPYRHYLGRVFATVASMVLDLAVYDTQCGAKLFRRGPALEAMFAEPLRTKWVFDVELLARFLVQRTGEGGSPEREILEQPLPAWRDVGTSKVKPFDFVTAIGDLWAIHRRYHPRRRRRTR